MAREEIAIDTNIIIIIMMIENERLRRRLCTGFFVKCLETLRSAHKVLLKCIAFSNILLSNLSRCISPTYEVAETKYQEISTSSAERDFDAII